MIHNNNGSRVMTAQELIEDTRERAIVWNAITESIASRNNMSAELVGGLVFALAKQNGHSDSVRFAISIGEHQLEAMVSELYSRYA